ncbi:hypothetical protein MOO46_05820 [Apilactobacillus apisilvae]|uniref:Lysozyme n=1 Tax=Apilactobacillus apisilvae TaxID=2923364 RepID=A0ABY4PG32_9LACO|nr:GH25 family lysozyme [Apilactobacillus apisilvae]UQS84761.1 hypothetical protein MOO46_05820 [Apilactobacillus apisilvae]
MIINKKAIKFMLVIVLLFCVFFFCSKTVNADNKSDSPVAYDISQYQGYLTDNQAKQLKKEIKFVILRVQDGSYMDVKFQNNVKLMNRYNIKYGVYSYSEYTNSYQARIEARRLHHNALGALFYVNDYELQMNKNSDEATSSWAHEMRKISGGKPVVLYGSRSKIDGFDNKTLKDYNNIWLASYSKYMPNPSYHYDLWQFTDKYPSVSLNQRLDANMVPYNGNINNLLYQKHKQGSKVHLENYYHQKNMSYFKVINKKGIPLYVNGKYLRTAKYGEVLAIKSFDIKNNRVMAKGNLATYTSRKTSVAIYQ